MNVFASLLLVVVVLGIGLIVQAQTRLIRRDAECRRQAREHDRRAREIAGAPFARCQCPDCLLWRNRP